MKRKIQHRRKRKYTKRKFAGILHGGASSSFLGFLFFILAFSLILGVGPAVFTQFRMKEILSNSGSPKSQTVTQKKNLQLGTFNALTPTPMAAVRANRLLRLAAPTSPAGPQCSPGNANVVIIFDQSRSMWGQNAINAKNAAKSIVDATLKNSNNNVGLVTMDFYARPAVDFSNDASLLKAAIDSIQITVQSTRVGNCMECGARAAYDMIKSTIKVGQLPSVIFLTTGRTTYVDGYYVPVSQATQTTKGEVAKGISELDIVYHTLRFGRESSFEALMKSIAASANGLYFYEPSGGVVENAFSFFGRRC